MGVFATTWVGTECMELKGANLQKKSASLQCAMNGATVCASGAKGNSDHH